ncbi:MAG TPA: helix-turn-helix domain-containing protein [Polyangia bacterium]|nr:helix-turn-helix domain-containing protein [Polyangia bacterium]
MNERDKSWKLEELARDSGVSARTVRYYVQRGLLPAPIFRGKDTAYSAEHLTRLRAIRRLQDRFLPLDAIQVELERRSLDELEQLADGKDPPAPTITYYAPVVAPRAPSHHVPMVPPPSYRTPATPGERFIKYQLAPGLELHVSDGADAQTRALADELRARCQGHRKGGTK